MAGIALMNFFRKRNGNPGGVKDLVAEKFCNERHEVLDKRLGRGVERFDDIDGELKEQRIIVTRIDTKLDLLIDGKLDD